MKRVINPILCALGWAPWIASSARQVYVGERFGLAPPRSARDTPVQRDRTMGCSHSEWVGEWVGGRVDGRVDGLAGCLRSAAYWSGNAVLSRYGPWVRGEASGRGALDCRNERSHTLDRPSGDAYGYHT